MICMSKTLVLICTNRSTTTRLWPSIHPHRSHSQHHTVRTQAISSHHPLQYHVSLLLPSFQSNIQYAFMLVAFFYPEQSPGCFCRYYYYSHLPVLPSIFIVLEFLRVISSYEFCLWSAVHSCWYRVSGFDFSHIHHFEIQMGRRYSLNCRSGFALLIIGSPVRIITRRSDAIILFIRLNWRSLKFI